MRVLRSAVLATCVAAALTLSVGVGASNAATDPAAPTVAPNPVVVGSSVTVSGADCTGSELFGVDVEILDSDDNSIAYELIDASDISGGDWSTTITIPGNTPGGTYDVAALCDDYVTGFIYPDASLTVTTNIHSTPGHPSTVTLGSSSVAAGSSLSLAGSGFMAGEQVKVKLHSTPVTLATWTASSSGGVSGTVVIPADTAAGSHEIALTGATSGSSATADLTVSSASGSPLPSTGANDNNIALVGLLLIGIGGFAILFTRRTRSAQRRDS